MSKGYNGWANYETWRVNLELYDGDDGERYSYLFSGSPTREELEDAVYELSERLREETEEWVDSQARDCHDLLKGWLHSWLGDVRWLEIAQHMGADIMDGINPSYHYWEILKP